jgi:calcineurin-like phosphoesterase family protein
MTETINTINENDYVLSDSHYRHYNICLHTSRIPWIYDNPAYDNSKPYHFKYNNPYAVNLKSHDEDILNNCLKIMPKGSRLIILGDFAYKDHRYFIDQLKKKAHKLEFIKGNHDKAPIDFYNVFRSSAVPEDMFDVKKECVSWLKKFQNGDVDISDCRDGIISSIWAKFANLQDWEMADQMSKECLNLFDSVHEMGWRTNIKNIDVTFCHYAMKSWSGSYRNSIQCYGHSHGRMPEFDNVLACDTGIDCWGYSAVPWCAIVEKMRRKQEWMAKNGKYPVDGENKAEGQYSKDFDQRVLDIRAQNKEIMKSLGYPIDDKMWPTEVLKWPKE